MHLKYVTELLNKILTVNPYRVKSCQQRRGVPVSLILCEEDSSSDPSRVLHFFISDILRDSSHTFSISVQDAY
jgi:hypothetical protein